uniref:Uncharacterized protein n=1 Tax=Arion vulgaris TaxID=1028688 RepID=A0A0B6ZMF2_9EUPU
MSSDENDFIVQRSSTWFRLIPPALSIVSQVLHKLYNSGNNPIDLKKNNAQNGVIWIQTNDLQKVSEHSPYKYYK